MARFRGTVQGQRGQASRLGHRALVATVNGWELGFDVEARPSITRPGADSVSCLLTGGSNGSFRRPHVVFDAIEREDGGVSVAVKVNGEMVWHVCYDDHGREIE